MLTIEPDGNELNPHQQLVMYSESFRLVDYLFCGNCANFICFLIQNLNNSFPSEPLMRLNFVARLSSIFALTSSDIYNLDWCSLTDWFLSRTSCCIGVC